MVAYPHSGFHVPDSITNWWEFEKTFDFFLGKENSECQKKNVSEQPKSENQQQTQPTKDIGPGFEQSRPHW